jgi:hypothetical protein
MRLKWQPEKSAKAWFLRTIIGPAMVLDGVCHFMSLGCLSVGASLTVSRRLAIARFQAIEKSGQNQKVR